MKNAKVRSLLGFLALAAIALLMAGCGSGKSATSTSAPTEEPTSTVFPTWTPAAPLLPETSSVTLQPAAAFTADGYLPNGLYVADASTGETFRVETAPGPLLGPRAWLSPTQLVVEGGGPDFSLYLLDLSTKTLRRLQASRDDVAVSFSHSSGLMTRLNAAGELVISSVADNREVARIPNGPTSYLVLWAPDDKHIYWPGAPAGISSVGPKPTVVAVGTTGAVDNVSWFGDGSALAFANAQGIFSIDADSGEQTLLYSWPPGSGANPSALKVSPDGKYALAKEGVSASDSVVVPLMGEGHGIQITGIDADHTDSSPVEDLVAVGADWCQAESRLLLVNPDGSIRASVVSQPDIQVPRFSADGNFIAYVGSGPQEKGMQDQVGVTVRKAEGGDNLVSFIAGFFDTAWWSPDGRWMAYSPTLLSFQCVSGLEKTQILPFP